MRGKASVALGFLLMIAIGAVVLASPWARAAGEWGNVSNAAFMACSAVCVTGLSVVDIASEFSLSGQIALLVLVELGCLGLITLGTFLMIAVGRRLSLSREFSLMDAYGAAGVKGLRGLIRWVIGSMVVVEGVGIAWLKMTGCGWWEAIWYSVMSFCNAGFSLRSGSLTSFVGCPSAIFVMGLMTIIGGIGFMVIYNICTFKFVRRHGRGLGRLSLHSRVVLRMTGFLLLTGAVIFMLFEWNGALKEFSPLGKVGVACYQALTPRTCGFSIVPTESVSSVTRLFYEVWMFIGGAPGSAAAGLKVTTLAVLIYTLAALCRGESETIILKRVVSTDVVRESLVIFMALIVLLVIVTALLTITERSSGIAADELFFEGVSAITTTGLSVGEVTRKLTLPGRFVIMLAMFAGRLGALTVVTMIGDRETVRRVRYPNEELVVG